MKYLLREINEEKWKKFKSQLALEGKSIKQALLEFIENYNEKSELSESEFNQLLNQQ